MRVYLTKYALTDGVREIDVEEPDENGLCGDGAPCASYHRMGRDCFPTRDEAIIDAEKRRKAKMASVKRQLARLEALAF